MPTGPWTGPHTVLEYNMKIEEHLKLDAMGKPQRWLLIRFNGRVALIDDSEYCVSIFNESTFDEEEWTGQASVFWMCLPGGPFDDPFKWTHKSDWNTGEYLELELSDGGIFHLWEYSAIDEEQCCIQYYLSKDKESGAVPHFTLTV